MNQNHTCAKTSKRNIWVVARRFPAVNQPWLDTYLEQLLKHEFELTIFSKNVCPDEYSSKVDELNLLEKTVDFPMKNREFLRGFAAQRRVYPYFLRGMATAKRLGFDFKEIFKAGLFSSWLIKTKSRALPAIIHSHSEPSSYYFLSYAVAENVPLILTFHGLPPKGVAQLKARQREILYRNVSKVIVNTEFAKNQVVGFGCLPEKITVLPQGIPLSYFPFSLKKPPLKSEPLRLLSIGRYHREKGHHYSLIALRRLLNGGINAIHTFVGVGPDLAYFKALSKKLELEGHVDFRGAVPSESLKQVFMENHLFILSSIDTPGGFVETQGVVLQEAQAMGCIPVATRTGGVPECINHMKDGVLVDQQSSRSLSDAVFWLYRNGAEWPSLQKAGRQNVEKHYDAELIGEEMATILSEFEPKVTTHKTISES